MGELGVEDETFCNSIRSFHLTGLLPAALHDRKVEPVILTGKFSQQSHGNEEVDLDPRTQKETSFHQDPRTYQPEKLAALPLRRHLRKSLHRVHNRSRNVSRHPSGISANRFESAWKLPPLQRLHRPRTSSPRPCPPTMRQHSAQPCQSKHEQFSQCRCLDTRAFERSEPSTVSGLSMETADARRQRPKTVARERWKRILGAEGGGLGSWSPRCVVKGGEINLATPSWRLSILSFSCHSIWAPCGRVATLVLLEVLRG